MAEELPMILSYAPTKEVEVPENWTIECNHSFSSDSELILADFHQPGETMINGFTMLERGWEIDVKEQRYFLGSQYHATATIEQQDRIPPEWIRYHLVFLGTIWRDPKDSRFMVVLEWNAIKWQSRLARLDDRWFRDTRLVRVMPY